MKSRTLVLSTVLLAVAASVPRGQEPASAVASKATFERLCGTCHEPERSTSSRRTRDQWLQTVNQMVARGAEGTDEELLGIVNYLTREHGRVNVNLAPAGDLALVLGLTPGESTALVQYRREHGTFEDAAAVAKVPGIDAAKLSARRDAMVFGSKVVPGLGRVPVSALTAANNWPSVAGGPQRENWARAEAMLSRDTAPAIKLIYSLKLNNQSRANYSLAPPLVLGNLISYRGFKEMLFVAGSSDNVYSIDAVLNRVLWSTKLPAGNALATAATSACPGGLGGIVMSGTAAGGAGGIVGGIRRGGPNPVAAAAAANAGRSGLVVGLSGGFGRNGLVLAVGSDGNVHPLYQSNGASFGTSLKFLPPNSTVRGLNLFDNTLYASTIDGCGGANAIYALDLSVENPTPAKFETGSGALGTGGTAIGNDGTVYVQVAEGRGATAGEYRDTVLALAPKTLQVKDYFTPAPAGAAPGDTRGITPVVFRWNNKDVVVAAGRDGQIFALDAANLGGADHRTPLAQTSAGGRPVRGAFASWEDPDTGDRWIYAPISGVGDGSPSGTVQAFKVDDRGGRPALTSQWIAHDLVSPVVAVANGLLFALSSGSANSRAVLRALDATTGKEVFSSGQQVTGMVGPASQGLAVANGRVYFTTQDNTVYCFGIPTEH